MQRPVSIFATQQRITPMQRVEVEVDSLKTLSIFFSLEYMLLIKSKKQKQQHVSMMKKDFFHSANLSRIKPAQ